MFLPLIFALASSLFSRAHAQPRSYVVRESIVLVRIQKTIPKNAILRQVPRPKNRLEEGLRFFEVLDARGRRLPGFPKVIGLKPAVVQQKAVANNVETGIRQLPEAIEVLSPAKKPECDPPVAPAAPPPKLSPAARKILEVPPVPKGLNAACPDPGKGSALTPPLTPAWTYEAAARFICEVPISEGGLEIVPRETWKPHEAYPTHMYEMAKEDVRGIVIHETRTEATMPPPPPFAVVQSIQKGHLSSLKVHGPRNEKGPVTDDPKRPFDPEKLKPGDIAYHYIIAQDPRGRWRIVEGRNTRYEGGASGDTPDIVDKRGKVVKRGGKHTNIGMIQVAIAWNVDDFSDKNPSGVPAGTPKYKRQPPPEAVALLVQLTYKMKRDFPALSRVYSHGGGERDSQGTRLGRNPAGSGCPGHDGGIHLVKALRERSLAEGWNKEGEDDEK